MPNQYLLTLLAKAWDTDRALAFLAAAESQGLTLKAEEARPLAGTGVWMQRAWASSGAALGVESLEKLREAAENASLDMFVEPEALYRTPRRLFVFDMDST